MLDKRYRLEIEKLISKRDKKAKELAKVNSEIEELTNLRRERYERLAYSEQSENDDRDLTRIKRSMPGLKEKREDLQDAIVAFDKAIATKSEGLRQLLEQELLQKSFEAENDYKQVNEAHLKMVHACNEFATQTLKPSRLQKDRSRRDVHSFEKNWTSEKIMEAIGDPLRFSGLPELATILNMEEELTKAVKKSDELIAQENRQNAKQAEEAKKKDKSLWARAQRIYSGREKMPEVLKRFGDSISMNVEVIFKLLKQNPSVEPEKKQQIFDPELNAFLDEQGDQFDIGKPKIAAGDEPV